MAETVPYTLVGSVNAQVTRGAATLPKLYTTVGEAPAVVAVSQGHVESAAADGAVARLLMNPSATGEAPISDQPLIVVDRWSGHQIVAEFLDAYGNALEEADFIHLRATVPAGTAPNDLLLAVVLLIERAAGIRLRVQGSHFSADHGVLLTGSGTTSRGSTVQVHASVVESQALLPNARLDVYGPTVRSTVSVPDREAGSAPGWAEQITVKGRTQLPSQYADLVRSALLRLRAVLEDDEPDDADRLIEARELTASLTASAA